MKTINILPLLILLAALAGCGTPPLTPAKITDAIPPSRELFDARLLASLSVAEAAELQLQFDAAKTEAAIKVAHKQSELDIATAQANAQIVADAKAAALERQISYLIAGIGIAAIVGAGFAIYLGQMKMGLLAAGLGLGLVLLSANLIVLDGIFRWTVAAMAVIGLATLVAWLLSRAWTWVQTNRQALAKRREASVLQLGGKHKEAAIVIAEAAVLEHVGSTGYDVKRVDASSEAMRLLNGG